jgi:hypothetical protein
LLPGCQSHLLVVVSVASTLECKIEVPGDLAGLESQGRGRAPHPVVGGAECPSSRAEFGRWDAVPVITVWWCCLVCAGWRRDGVCPKMGDSCPLSPSGVSGACLSLSELAYLVELNLPSAPSQGSGRRRGRTMLRSVRQKEKGEVVVDHTAWCVAQARVA